MSATENIRMKNPAHPGDFVKSEIIEPLCLSVTVAVLIQEQSDNIKAVCRDLLNKATALLGGADCPVLRVKAEKQALAGLGIVSSKI